MSLEKEIKNNNFTKTLKERDAMKLATIVKID